jgi:anti-sigma regulatory factor (Ser/Thr protein kinase)
MSETPALTLGVAARAENVAIVRQALGALGETIGLGETAVSDLKTIVTEAALNAVVHAYEDEPGALEVAAWLHDEGLEVAVRDEGSGFKPEPADSARGGRLRLGIPLIAALSDRFEIRAAPRRGTEIRIHKRIVPEPGVPERRSRILERETTLEFSPGTPVQPVLARVLGALAARADLSIDRLSDVQMLGDAVSAEAPSRAPEEALDLAITATPGRLELRVGPLRPGGADHVLDAMEMPGPPIGALRELASEIRTERPDEGELLVIAVEEEPSRAPEGRR